MYGSRVVSLVKCGRKLYGVVVGRATYRAVLDLKSGSNECTCPVGLNCKHIEAMKQAYREGWYIETDSEVKAILSLLYTAMPETIFQKETKKLVDYGVRRAWSFLYEWEPGRGYATLMEAAGIAYALYLLLNRLSRSEIKKLKREILSLIKLSVRMTERTDFPVIYSLVEYFWDILASNFSVSEFKDRDRERLYSLFLESLPLFEENEELYRKVRAFLKGIRKIFTEGVEKYYIHIYTGLLGITDLEFGGEETYKNPGRLYETLNICIVSGDIRCIYGLITILALSSFLLFLKRDPQDRLDNLFSTVARRNSEAGRILREDLARMGYIIKKGWLGSPEIAGVKTLSYEEAAKIMEDVLAEKCLEKSLFYAAWINVDNPLRLAELLKDKSPALAAVFYLRSDLTLEKAVEKLLELFEKEPEIIKHALVAVLHKEVKKAQTPSYVRAVENLKTIEKLVKNKPHLKTHYTDVLEELASLNYRKHKFLKLLKSKLGYTPTT